MVIHGFDVYRQYLAMKQHFSNPKFDYFQYDGKVNAKEKTYQQRTDFWFFETLAKKLKKREIPEYMLATFIRSENPSKVWIGDIQRSGKDNWLVWQKRTQSIKYIISQDFDRLVDYMESTGNSFDNLFETMGGHPTLLKLHIQQQVCLETLIVLDNILHYTIEWDERMKDPLWKRLSFKIKKYKPFLNLPIRELKSLLKQKILTK